MCCLIPGLGKVRRVPELLDDSHPAGLRGLPGALILIAHISAVDHLVAIGGITIDHNAQGRILDGLEAHGNLAKIEIDISDHLSGLHGNGVEAEGVVVAGEQIGRQHLIYTNIQVSQEYQVRQTEPHHRALEQ